MEIQEFEGQKPNIVKFHVNAGVNRIFGVESIAAFDDEFFKSLPLAMQDDIKSKVDHLSSSPNLESMHASTVKSLRDAQGILGAIKQFIPKDVLHEIEFGQRAAVDAKTEELLEKAKGKKDKLPYDHKGFRDAVQTPFFQAGDNVRNFINPLYGDEFMDYLFNKRGKGSLAPENINLYNADGSLFKIGEDTGSKLFDSYEEFKVLQDRAMSPRAILLKRDPQFFQRNAEVLDKIQSKRLKGKMLDGYKSEFITKDDPDLNYEVKDPYKRNKIDTIQVKANFHDIISAGFWKEFSSEDAFAFMSQAYDNVSRFSNIAREAFGDFSSFIKMDGKADVPNRGEAASGPIQQGLMNEEARLKGHVDQWWDSIKESLPDSMLSVYSMFGALSQMMLNSMAWGDWDKGTGNPDVLAFRKTMVEGYAKHARETYLNSYGSDDLTPEIFKGNENVDGTAIMKTLKDRGLIIRDSSTGKTRVSGGFDPFDPNQHVEFGLNHHDTEFVMDKIRRATAGPLSFLVQDTTRVNNLARRDMKVTGSDGKSRTLREIVSMIGQGGTPKAIAQNTKIAYDQLMKIHNAMTDIKADGGRSKGTISPSRHGGNGVTVKVSENATWKEWHVERKKVNGKVTTNQYWKDKEGDLEIQFSSQEKALEFKKGIREIIAVMEPMAVVFGRHLDSNPMHILVDNSASSKYTQTITDDSPEYVMGVDQLIDSKFLQSKLFHHVTQHVEFKAVSETLGRGGARSLVNNLNQIKFEKDWEEYDQKEEDHYKNELARVKREQRLKKDRKKIDKDRAKRVQKEQSQRKADDKKRASKSQANRQARRSAQTKRK